MEVEYSIGVNNRFGALNLDEEDPEESLQKQEKKEESAKKDKAKKQDKKAAKQPVKDTKPAVSRKDNVNEESKREGLVSIFTLYGRMYKLYCDAIFLSDHMWKSVFCVFRLSSSILLIVFESLPCNVKL